MAYNYNSDTNGSLGSRNYIYKEERFVIFNLSPLTSKPPQQKITGGHRLVYVPIKSDPPQPGTSSVGWL